MTCLTIDDTGIGERGRQIVNGCGAQTTFPAPTPCSFPAAGAFFANCFDQPDVWGLFMRIRTLRITTALPFTLFAVPITQETTDNVFPALRVKGHLIAASKSKATGTETLEASGLYKAEWFVHRDSGVPS